MNKNLITLKLIIALLFSSVKMANAQTAASPTFEQTVDYIVSNTKGRVMYPGALDAYSRVRGYTLKNVIIERNGKITFVTEQKYDYNDFTIIFNIFDLVATTEYPEGVRAKDFLVHFNGLNVSSGYGIVYATQNDALKVARAFRHLRAVCKKPENDLFSQPEQKEKNILSKEETLKYINKNIIPGAKFGLNCSECHEMNYYDGGKSRKTYTGFSSYSIESHELLSATKYVIHASGGECIRNDSRNGYPAMSVEGSCNSRLDITCNFDMLKFIGFETIRINDKHMLLKLNFEQGTIKPSIFLSNIDYNKPNVLWTSSHLAFYVASDKVERTKKAFEHLRILMIEEKQKAEENDPFGN